MSSGCSPGPGSSAGIRRRPEPDWAELVIDLKKPGVTMMVLWEEYRAVQPGGYGYSRFCELFRGFERRLQPSMRQDHVAGDKVFVDYSGKKIADRRSAHRRGARGGDLRRRARRLQLHLRRGDLDPDTAGLDRCARPDVPLLRRRAAPGRARQPEVRASTRPRSTIPEINRSYGMMASHYGVGVLPARPRRPKDKAKVENGVRFAQTCILGRLRRQTFFSLAEANAAIAGALERINDHVIRRLGVTRRHLFETIERHALAPLPGDDYEFAEWRLARVGVDYHVEYDGFFYSVPHGLIRAQVDVRATSRTIELFHRGKRVAAASAPLRRPSARHRSRSHAQLAPPLCGLDAGPLPPLGGFGRARTPKALVTAILAHRPHPEQGFRTCLGVLRLFRDLEAGRAEAVSARALADRCADLQEHRFHPGQPPEPPTRSRPSPTAVIDHANLRGPGYFH